jgi:hypothetical protein
MNERSSEVSRSKVVSIYSLGAILGGILLIITSLLPWGEVAKEALWTEEDSQTFAKISTEYHRLSYQTPQRAGVSEEQLNTQVEKAKAHFEALEAKLTSAQQRPDSWKRYLLWVGALLAICGAVAHFASDRR